MNTRLCVVMSKLSTARVSLADIFHPWVHWERPGSGFESSFRAGAGSDEGLQSCRQNTTILRFETFGYVGELRAAQQVRICKAQRRHGS